MLVAVLNNERHRSILRAKLCYRIPVASAPNRWPPRRLAFYQTKVLGDESFRIDCYAGRYGRSRCDAAKSSSWTIRSTKSERKYYQIHLHCLERMEKPIVSHRLRRIVLVPTAWAKFSAAAEINGLYDESPLEDRLWAELQQQKITAERQWVEMRGQAW